MAGVQGFRRHIQMMLAHTSKRLIIIEKLSRCFWPIVYLTINSCFCIAPHTCLPYHFGYFQDSDEWRIWIISISDWSTRYLHYYKLEIHTCKLYQCLTARAFRAHLTWKVNIEIVDGKEGLESMTLFTLATASTFQCEGMESLLLVGESPSLLHWACIAECNSGASSRERWFIRNHSVNHLKWCSFISVRCFVLNILV